MTERNPISGVDYEILDPFKLRAGELARQTAHHLNQTGAEELTESRGESAFIWEENGVFRAMTLEGLGTKNLVADEMCDFMLNGGYYRKIAQDTVATIINDLATVGAVPQAILMGVMAGQSEWFKTKEGFDFLEGWKEACDIARVTWGGGESQALADILTPKRAAFFGAATGLIGTKNDLIIGENLKLGNVILGIESSGIHANGLTDVRNVVKNLPSGFATKLPSGRMLGDVILEPSYIYSQVVSELTNELKPLYIANITGHGLQKIMRHPKNLTYRISHIPEPQEEFRFIQEKTGYTDEKMYSTFNMGVGYVLFVNEENVKRTMSIIREDFGFETFILGSVEKGPREVDIVPLNIKYDKLGVR